MYDIQPLDLSDSGLEACVGLIRKAFPHTHHITKAYLDWAYNQNPDGAALGFNAYDQETLISHCVVQPLRARLFGTSAKGVLSMHATTHPDYQRKGLYFDLAEKTYALAKEKGYEFGVAVTNDKSTPGFVKNIGFQLVKALDVKLGLGPLKYDGAPPVAFEKQWQGASIAWRLARPGAIYRISRKSEAIRVEGLAGKAGIKVIMDEFREGLSPGPVPACSLGYNPIRLWAGLDPAIEWKKSFYFSLPVKLRPSPLNFIFLDLTGQNRQLNPEESRWWPFDFDDF